VAKTKVRVGTGEQTEGIVKTKAWNIAEGVVDAQPWNLIVNLILIVVVVGLVFMPVLLTQLLIAKPGTVWRVLGLDVAWSTAYFLVCFAGAYIIKSVIDALPGSEIWKRPLGRSLGLAFSLATANAIIDLAERHLALSQTISWFCAGLLGGFFAAASFELWRYWRKRRNPQLSAPA
jgi:hypothetical protein